MAKPKIVDIHDWLEVVHQFEHESDRGLAVLAGSFVEHALGAFLQRHVADKGVGEKLFGPVGPLSSFSQRTLVAYAFGLLTKAQYEDLEAIRQARNYFAHDPLHATFSSPEVQKHTKRMTHFETEMHEGSGTLHKHRLAYGFTCSALLHVLLPPSDKPLPKPFKVRSRKAESAA